MEPASEPEPAPAVVFRSSKKRKANLRQRAPDDDDDNQHPSIDPSTADIPALQTVDELIASAAHAGSKPGLANEPSVAEALRLRAQRRHRHKGVGFTSSVDDAASTRPERALVVHAPPDDEPIGGMTTRFAPQTGLSSQLVNKHM